MERVTFKKLSENGQAPVKMSFRAAGYDLKSAYDYIITPGGGRRIIKTDISISFPVGYYGRIADRSSFAMKGFIVAGGVIDADYKGNVGIIMINTTADQQCYIKKGERVAQIVVEKYFDSQLIYEETEEGSFIPYLKGEPESMRGKKGFGSTGV